MTATRAEREPPPWDAQETRCAKSQRFWVFCSHREPWPQGQDTEGDSKLLLPGREKLTRELTSTGARPKWLPGRRDSEAGTDVMQGGGGSVDTV